jgi:hypothetical protein
MTSEEPSLTLRNSQRRRPLVPQDIQTNRAICIDIGVVDLGCEADFRGLKGVVRRECDGQEENTSGIW